MLRLRDIMTTDVVTTSPELTLRDAMELLASRHVSGAPVVAGGEVLGVVSSTDLMALAARIPGVPTDRSGQQVELGEEPPAAYFTEMWDDARVDVAERVEHPEGPEWNALEDHTVSEAMTRAVCALPPSATLPEAADYMRGAGVHRVLVMEGARLVGVVSAMDVAKAVADHRLETRTYVFNRDGEFDDRGRAEPMARDADDQS